MEAKSVHRLAVLSSLIAAHIVQAGAGQSAKASDPLRVHPANSRYFTDGTKNADGWLKANIERLQKMLDANNVPEATREKMWGLTMAKVLAIDPNTHKSANK